MARSLFLFSHTDSVNESIFFCLLSVCILASLILFGGSQLTAIAVQTEPFLVSDKDSVNESNFCPRAICLWQVLLF